VKGASVPVIIKLQMMLQHGCISHHLTLQCLLSPRTRLHTILFQYSIRPCQVSMDCSMTLCQNNKYIGIALWPFLAWSNYKIKNLLHLNQDWFCSVEGGMQRMPPF
jgi:hypothetical protein